MYYFHDLKLHFYYSCSFSFPLFPSLTVLLSSLVRRLYTATCRVTDHTHRLLRRSTVLAIVHCIALPMGHPSIDALRSLDGRKYSLKKEVCRVHSPILHTAPHFIGMVAVDKLGALGYTFFEGREVGCSECYPL